jgi:hypothetical protein
MDLVLLETVSLPLADSSREADRGPSIRAEPRYHELRFRRRLAESPSTRTWWLEVAAFVRVEDPEQLLHECEGFLVDSTDNRSVGIVDGVETEEETGYVSALEVAAGWFGRRRFRIAVEAIELVVPADERIVVRIPLEGLLESERPLS